jgi:DNA-binding NtrC family response regulator
MSGILLANIDQSTTTILSKLLKTEGYKVDAVTDALLVADKLAETTYDLVLTSAGGPSDPELNLVRKIRADHASLPVIVIIENSDAETMGTISELSPFACLEKPLKIDQMLTTVQRAVDFHGLLDSDSVNLNLQLESTYQFEGIVAESPVMKSVCDMVSRVAGTDVTVLITGEKGTGKSLIAETLHTFSRRKDKAMASVNCSDASAEETLFGVEGTPSALDKACGGTLYLRQIEDLGAEAQETLAGILASKKFISPGDDKEKLLDARVIASGTGNLEELAAGGDLSLALYKMLKVIVIKIPPLRDRVEDIVPTLRMTMQDQIEAQGGVLPNMDQDVVDLLEKYPWPGNSKEIQMIAGHALGAQIDGSIALDSLPPQIKSGAR